MRLEWSNREASSGRYWLELFDNDNKKVSSILLVDCQHESMGYKGVIRYKYSGVTILDDILLGEAMEEVEDYMLNWWEKRYSSAERDYLEAMEVVEFLKGELNG